MSLVRSYSVGCDGINGDWRTRSEGCLFNSAFYGDSQTSRRRAIKRGWTRVAKRDLCPACTKAENGGAA